MSTIRHPFHHEWDGCPHAQFDAPSDSHSPGVYDAVSLVSKCVESAAKCRECRVLLQVIEDFKPGWIEEHKEGKGMIRVSYERNHARRYQNPPFVEIYVDRVEEGSLREKWEGRDVMGGVSCLDIVEDSGSQTAFERATKWLSYCLEHDDLCKPPPSQFIPRRLIDVGLENSGDPFLVEPEEPVQYACLSYCWGPDTQDVLKTIQSNLESHHQAIPQSKTQ
ncbi:hypothetical protein N0V90_001596 [Kalmusia sp. IMI 367209]|nr:hypothetical protein N0V90_001596 [Kalmusia sp. IMI 367209]